MMIRFFFFVCFVLKNIPVVLLFKSNSNKSFFGSSVSLQYKATDNATKYFLTFIQYSLMIVIV